MIEKSVKRALLKETIVVVIVIIAILVFGNILTSHGEPSMTGFLVDVNLKNYEMPSNESDIVARCSNMNLANTAACLVGNVETFYKYVDNPDWNNLNFTSIQQIGGDCKDWAQLYNRMIKQLPEGKYAYSGEYVNFPIDKVNKVAHAVAIIGSEEGYCIIDQVSYTCSGVRNG